MEKSLFSLKKYNFWESGPEKLGFIRGSYQEHLKKLLNTSVIKVLSGQRRTGKSYILRQFIHYLINDLSVARENILYINLELMDFQSITNVEKLEELINLYFNEIKPNTKKTIYLFIDEIQEVEGWEKLLNSYLADSNIDAQIFITGSNSNLLASELATYITGRYISKKVYPFSYQEFLDYYQQENNEESFKRYLTISHLPETFILQDTELITSYLSDLKDSILLKDIVKRYKVENIDLLERLFLYIVNNIGNLFSINSIVNKLKTEGFKTNTNTISNYLKYFQNTYLIHGVDRFDIKGKRILEGEKKYYLNDLGFKKFLVSQYDLSSGSFLENYVYNCLIQSGYKVHVGKINNLEIDFVAEKQEELKYIQVAYILYDEKVIKREFGNLEKINDHWEKIVVSMDPINMGSKAGIRHIQAWDLPELLTHPCS